MLTRPEAYIKIESLVKYLIKNNDLTTMLVIL